MEAFEEQTLLTAPEPPRIWKRCVDETFTVMKQHNADNFLSHLNQQHPSIRFTIETENNNKIPFLDTLVTREPDGKLLTSVYRKPTRTDQYHAYDSHIHNLLNAVLSSVYMIELNASSPSHPEQPRRKAFIHSSRHTPTFLQKVTKTRNPTPKRETAEFKSTAILPYIKGVSDPSAATYSDKEYVPSLNSTPH